MATVVPYGTSVRATVMFRDENEDLVSPTTITAKVRDPAGNVTTTTPITPDSTGIAHHDFTVNVEGTWQVRIEGTGVLVAAEEATIVVPPTDFA